RPRCSTLFPYTTLFRSARAFARLLLPCAPDAARRFSLRPSERLDWAAARAGAVGQPAAALARAFRSNARSRVPGFALAASPRRLARVQRYARDSRAYRRHETDGRAGRDSARTRLGRAAHSRARACEQAAASRRAHLAPGRGERGIHPAT